MTNTRCPASFAATAKACALLVLALPPLVPANSNTAKSGIFSLRGIGLSTN